MSSNKFRAAAFLASLTFTLVGLSSAWVSAAHAQEGGADVSFEADVIMARPPMQCWRKPLGNGRVGETVLVCENGVDSCDASIWDGKVRIGCTTVTHFGSRGGK